LVTKPIRTAKALIMGAWTGIDLSILQLYRLTALPYCSDVAFVVLHVRMCIDG